MKPILQMTIKQSLSLSPKLQQAIRLLQLSASELDSEIKAALDNNPLLEIVENWDEQIATPSTECSYDAHTAYNNTPSLHDYLHWQLNLTHLSDRDHVIAITIIDSINEDGYLDCNLEEILQGIKHNYPEFYELDLAEVLAVLHRIQQFDPAGIGARDLIECMILQVQALEILPQLRTLCMVLIKSHLELLANKDFTNLKKLLQINDQELTQVIDQIKRLHPKPGMIIAPDTTEYILPDVLVEKHNNIWQISLNSNLTQQLRINSNYTRLMRHATNEFQSAALRKQYAEAQWLLDSIKNRNVTLLKVAGYIVRYQNAFLEHGEARMRPLTLQVIAQDLGLSESTISRITSRKYMHTPRGTYELKFFFSSQVAGAMGENCSSIAVKAIIKQLISQETRDQPLSDQDLANLIAQRGINIARRTVAKYREALGIQSSNQRGT